MYDPRTDATTYDERFARDGETLFDHVHRVIESWKHRTGPNALVFGALPSQLKREHPDVFCRFTDEALGTMLAGLWLYLGGKGTVNEHVIRAWLRDAMGGEAPPAS